MMKSSLFLKLSFALLFVLSFSSCEKDQIENLGKIEQVYTPAIGNAPNGITPTENGFIVNSCNCEYQVMSISPAPSNDGAAFLDYYLTGGDLCSGTSCFQMSAYGSEEQCQSYDPNCEDVLDPNNNPNYFPTAFMPFNCGVDANSSFTVGWQPSLYQPGCNFQLLFNASITFKIRCQNTETSSECLGYGYYSDPITINYVLGNDASVLIGLGGKCGCAPRVHG